MLTHSNCTLLNSLWQPYKTELLLPEVNYQPTSCAQPQHLCRWAHIHFWALCSSHTTTKWQLEPLQMLVNFLYIAIIIIHHTRPPSHSKVSCILASYPGVWEGGGETSNTWVWGYLHTWVSHSGVNQSSDVWAIQSSCLDWWYVCSGPKHTVHTSG